MSSADIEWGHNGASRPMLYLLFLLSGLSGLIYQVVWVRAFGNVFGNTIYSASLVVAVFMLGLGVGSYVIGAWSDRRYRARPDSLLRVFGSVEMAIGTLALGLSALLPHLGNVSASFSSYTRGSDGWYVLSTSSHLTRAALAVGLLAPITLLMGGTLTLLIRHLVRRDLHLGGWRIALLYAANTAGAALGCFLTDFALVPALGLRGTQGVAFALNVAAAMGALYLGRRTVPLVPDAAFRTRPAQREAAPYASHESGSTNPRGGTGGGEAAIGWTAGALALSGFAAMGMEIVWFRHFSILLGEYRAVFSLLLTVILCGIGAGSLAGGWLHQRLRQPALVWTTVQTVFVVSTLAGLLSVHAEQIQATAVDVAGTEGWGRAWTEVWFNAYPILLVVGLPSLAMGAAFPLANALVQRVEEGVGRRAGLLYLANTAGAVGGSLAAGFLLLPILGVQHSVAALAFVGAAAIVPLRIAAGAGSRAGSEAARPAARTAFGSLAACVAALVGWLLLPENHLISRELRFPLENAHAVSEGLTEVIAVTDGPDGGRVLVTNGHPMSSTELFSQRYMRAMAHIPLLSIDRPDRVLVLCYGVGNTAHAATLHPSVRRVDVVDLSRHVLQHSRYFDEVNHGVLQDPRVAVYVNDGRHHLRMAEAESYDLITLEPPPIVHAGVAALYSREFYAAARSRLTPKGYISQWLPVFGVPEEMILSMVRAFIDVFPNAVLLSGASTNLLLIGARDGATTIDPGHVERALAGAPAVHADLERLDLGTLREILGTFVADSRTLAAATAAAAPVTDDRPIQEYGKRSLLDFGVGGIPPSLVAVGNVGAWCPGCLHSGRPTELVEGLDTYLSVIELAYLAQPPATSATAPLPPGRTILGSGYLGAIVPDSPALQARLQTASPTQPETEDVAERYARATALLESGRFTEAAVQFRAVLEAAPDAVQAHNNLGVALASLGRLDEAIDAFQQALALQPDFADARRNLTLALEQRR